MIRILIAFVFLTVATVSDAAVAVPVYDIEKTAVPPTIDGDTGEFSNINPITITNAAGTTGNYRLMWDDEALYIAASVSDTQLNSSITTRDGALWTEDSIELFFDTLHDHGFALGADDYKFYINPLNTQGDANFAPGVGMAYDTPFTSAVRLNGTNNNNADVDVGYEIEIKIPWTGLGIAGSPINKTIGFDISMNDKRATTHSQAQWANTTGGGSNDPNGWGNVTIVSAVQINKVSIETARLSWNWIQGAGASASEFRVKCGSVSGVYMPPFYTAPAQPLNVAIKDAVGSPGKYFCVVTAANSNGESDPSNEVVFEAVGLPTAPGNLTIN